ncbi:SbtR family transcriptional regulator, partial [Mycobacteroides abscessus]|uniref:SbtR family transcriptional regulator n=1 Tax=Mycobacteroides abscessus TaxID=36809 RepID=UPI000AFBA95A
RGRTRPGTATNCSRRRPERSRPPTPSRAGDLRADVTAEDIAASLIGIFTVAPRPEQEAQADRLLNLLMDGLRPAARQAQS